MNASVTALYAALGALLLVTLSLYVVRARRQHRVGLGPSGNREVEHAMRVQANLTEYMPMVLILMLLLEQAGMAKAWMHGFGVVFIVARCLHAWGFGRERGTSSGRVLGTVLTFVLLLTLAVLLVVKTI